MFNIYNVYLQIDSHLQHNVERLLTCKIY